MSLLRRHSQPAERLNFVVRHSLSFSAQHPQVELRLGVVLFGRLAVPCGRTARIRRLIGLPTARHSHVHLCLHVAGLGTGTHVVRRRLRAPGEQPPVPTRSHDACTFR
jgi:hypothetical protein